MRNIKHLKINTICFQLMVFLLLNLTCYAQEQKTLKVDYPKIEKFVKSNNNQFEQLITRFENGDTTLTLEDIANIYYGSFYSTNYSYVDASQSLEDKMKEKDYANAFILCKEELKQSPASLDLLFKASICAQNTGISEDVYSQRIVQILDVIFASGDGRSEKTAYKVVAVSDEYFIIYAVFGANLKAQALVGHCDVMTVYEDEAPDETVDLYFDVSLHLSQLDAIFGGSLSKSKKAGKKSKVKSKMVVD